MWRRVSPPLVGERIYDPRTGQLVVSGVITDENGLRWYPVENVTYNLRVTHAGSQALVANYYSPGRKNPVAEDYYLLFDHRPSVSQRAMAMWQKRALIPGLPQNPQDALARAELGDCVFRGWSRSRLARDFPRLQEINA